VSAPIVGPKNATKYGIKSSAIEFDCSKNSMEETHMKIWSKPAVRETEVGLEVTSYLPAEIDVI
jgi:coenzyme PQQ precursor peptide PqqA